MIAPKICCVTPTIRPDRHAEFVRAWAPLFEKHKVTLITIWDGDYLECTFDVRGARGRDSWGGKTLDLQPYIGDLICRRTDACRNAGFLLAAITDADLILTLDDDVAPLPTYDVADPIQSHIDALNRRVPISWMNTAHDTGLYLRGFPYSIRDEAPVMMSHGVWVGTPDFDGQTQLRLEATESSAGGGVPYSLPYYVGPIPRGVYSPLCGMNLMFRREALPYVYFAPMGPDAGVSRKVVFMKPGIVKREGDIVYQNEAESLDVPELHRFGDIWMGLFAKKKFDEFGWAIYTGASTIHHTRASNAKKNVEQEHLGLAWNEAYMRFLYSGSVGRELSYVTRDARFIEYFASYEDKRKRYAELMESILAK